MTTTTHVPAAATTGRGPLLATALAAGLLLGGCASTTTASNPQDPFESYNRSMYAFNDGVDRAVLKPVATAYQEVTPSFVQTGVSNFFSNLTEPWSFVNHVLQGNGLQAYNTLVRFTTNTVLGLGGVLDIASEMRVERNKQDFGLTLGRWGAPSGPYLVLPLLGPSTVRDAAALPVDWQGGLIGEVHDVPVRNSLYGLRIVDTRAGLLQAGDTLQAVALDPYAVTRDVFLQLRQSSKQRAAAGADDNAGRLPPEE